MTFRKSSSFLGCKRGLLDPFNFFDSQYLYPSLDDAIDLPMAKRFRMTSRDSEPFLFPSTHEPSLTLRLGIWDDSDFPITLDSLPLSPPSPSPLPSLLSRPGLLPASSAVVIKKQTLSIPVDDVSTDAQSLPETRPLPASKPRRAKPPAEAKPRPHVTSRLNAVGAEALRKFLGWKDLQGDWEKYLEAHPMGERVTPSYFEEMKPICEDLQEITKESLMYQELHEEADILYNALNTVMAWRQAFFKAVQGSKHYNKLTTAELRHGINCWVGTKIFP